MADREKKGREEKAPYDELGSLKGKLVYFEGRVSDAKKRIEELQRRSDPRMVKLMAEIKSEETAAVEAVPA